MTRSRHITITLLGLCSVTACTSPDYGEPTSSTMIGLHKADGFLADPVDRDVRIAGTTVTYTAAVRSAPARMEQATIATADVAAIIAALEDIEFLDLDGDYVHCTNASTDLPVVTIDVALTAGTHTVEHYLGCHGRIFDKLAALEQRIFDLSGFTEWSLPSAPAPAPF